VFYVLLFLLPFLLCGRDSVSAEYQQNLYKYYKDNYRAACAPPCCSACCMRHCRTCMICSRFLRFLLPMFSMDSMDLSTSTILRSISTLASGRLCEGGYRGKLEYAGRCVHVLHLLAACPLRCLQRGRPADCWYSPFRRSTPCPAPRSPSPGWQ